MRRTSIRQSGLAFATALAVLLGAARSDDLRAQTPSGNSPPPAALPAALPAPSAVPGAHVGVAQATVVGGNVASARERALADALKQAVAQAVETVVPEPTRAAQPKVLPQILSRARTYVRRYRTLEEGELPGRLYGVRVEAEIDEPALHRAFDRASDKGSVGGGAGPLASGDAGRVVYLLAAAGPAEATTAVTTAITGAGGRVELAPAGVDSARLAEVAAKVKASAAVMVNAAASAEGKVRGPGLESVSCTLGARVVATSTGTVLADENVTSRAFAQREEGARTDCFNHAAAVVVARLTPFARSTVGNELRSVVIDAEVAEPAAVPVLMKALRGLGAVSSVDVRRIAPGHVELSVRTRLAAQALASVIQRDAAGTVTLSSPEATGDVIRARARLKTNEGGVP